MSDVNEAEGLAEPSEQAEAFARAQHDARHFLGALLEGASHLLVQAGELGAIVVTSKGEHVALLPFDSEPALSQRLDRFLAEARPGMNHAVVFGADASVDRMLTDKRTSQNRASLWRADTRGQLTQVAGHSIDALKKAAARYESVATPTEDQLAAHVAKGEPLRRDMGAFARELARGTPWVTYTILAVCVTLFALGFYWGGGEEMRANWRMGANHGELVRAGEWWRVLASAFLHGSPMHIIVNMLALTSLGRMLERVLGMPRYLALYGLSALGGGLASALLTPGGSVGASGAIWGLMGAAIALSLRPRGLLPELGREQMRKRAFGTLFVNVMISFLPGIDKYAHFGGGLVGAGLVFSGAITSGVAPLWQPSEKTRGNLGWGVVSALLSVAMIASVGTALAAGKPWELRGPLHYETRTLEGTGVDLDLPRELPKAKPSHTIADVPSFQFGEVKRDPVLLEIFVHRFGAPIDENSRTQLFAEILAQQQKAPADYRTVDAPTEQVLGKGSFIRTRYVAAANEDVKLVIYHGLIDDVEVRADFLSLPGRTERWDGLEDEVMKSLRVAN